MITKKHNKARKAAAIAATALSMAAFATVCVYMIDGMAGGQDGKAMARMEDAVRQAAVACYAAEGSYPDTLDYLVERYGLQLDRRYAVHYDVFASNLAPDVTVVTIPSEEEIWGK